MWAFQVFWIVMTCISDLFIYYSFCRIQGLFIKDSNSLAFYNFVNNSTIQLGIKERGGRKRWVAFPTWLHRIMFTCLDCTAIAYRVKKWWRHKKLFFFFAFQHFKYHISVEHDEKPPQSKFGGNQFMGTRDMAAWIPNYLMCEGFSSCPTEIWLWKC